MSDVTQTLDRLGIGTRPADRPPGRFHRTGPLQPDAREDDGCIDVDPWPTCSANRHTSLQAPSWVFALADIVCSSRVPAPTQNSRPVSGSRNATSPTD